MFTTLSLIKTIVFVYYFENVFMKKMEWVLPVGTIMFVISILFNVIPEEDEIFNSIGKNEINRLKIENKIILESNMVTQYKLLELVNKVDSLLSLIHCSQIEIE